MLLHLNERTDEAEAALKRALELEPSAPRFVAGLEFDIFHPGVDPLPVAVDCHHDRVVMAFKIKLRNGLLDPRETWSNNNFNLLQVLVEELRINIFQAPKIDSVLLGQKAYIL